jgi:hypothetical protein
MRQRVLTILLAPLLLVATVAAGPIYAPESLERYFRLEWQVLPGPTLEGYVYNKTDMPAGRMQISIEQLDAAGNVLGQTREWVLGDVPPGGRAFYLARVPQAASYRVSVLPSAGSARTPGADSVGLASIC